MTVRKTTAFNAPYVGKTFQALADDLVGVDGYLEGAKTTEAGGLGAVAPYKYIQRGIVVENDAATTGLVLPTAAEPWFVIAATPDDDVSTAVSVRVSSDLNEVVAGAVVLAYKTNGSWKNPLPLTALGAATPRSDSGLLGGFAGFGVISANAVASVQVNKGELVDPTGVRRGVGTDLVPAAAQSFTPVGTFKDLNRTDYAILRQRENATGEIIHALGDVQGHSQFDPLTNALVTSATAKAPSGVAKRGDLVRTWWAYGDGTALKVAGPILPATLLTGGGTINYVVLAGFRTADSAVICVYTDGNAVRVAAFNSTTGVLIGSAVTIDTQANACIRLSAVLDSANVLHVVYQHDEGGSPPNQQIYYVKVSVVAATFGVALAGTPRLANDVNSTRNDTYPSVAVDRRRRAHIAYATGTTSDEFGQLRYIVIDENGLTVSKTSYNTYGYQPDPFSRKGIETRAHNSVQRPRIVVTPHDEVYVLGHAIETASSDSFLVLFSPDFPTRLGYAMVQLREFVPYALSAGKALASFDMCADELGQLQVVSSWGTTLDVCHGRLQTPFAPGGVIGESYNEVAEGTRISEIASFVRIAPGATGGLVYSSIVGTSIKVATIQSRLNGRRFRPHPKDVVLSGWMIKGSDPISNTIPEAEFGIFNTRSKRVSFPFLVGGDDGDFVGFDALHDACAEASQRGGAQVIVRSGEYKGVRQLRIDSGVAVRADGLAILEFIDSTSVVPWISLNGSALSFTVSGISGQVVTLAYLTPQLGRISPGDLIKMATSGFHRVRRVVNSSAASVRVVLDGVAPVGASAILYATGIRLENLVVRGSSSTAPLAQALYCSGAVLKNITFFGSQAVEALACTGLRESVLENIDVSGVTVSGAGVGIQMSKGQGNTLRACRFGSATSGGGQLHVLAGADEDLDLVVSHCTGPEDTSAVYVIATTRTTPLYFHGSRGVVSGDLAHCTRELRDTGDTLRGDIVPDTTNTRKLGSAALAFAEFYARVIRPDVDNTGGIGDVAKRYISAYINTVNAQALLGVATGVPAKTPLTLVADPGQQGPMVKVSGMHQVDQSENAVCMDATGNWIYRGNRFMDDFNYEGEDITRWTKHVFSSGSVGIPVTGFRSMLSLQTGTSINSLVTYTTVAGIGWKAGEMPFFRARVALRGAVTALEMYISIGSLSFAMDTNFGTNPNSLHVLATRASDDTNIDQGIDLSSFPIADTSFFYIWGGILSDTDFFWGVGTIPDEPDLRGVQTLLAGATFSNSVASGPFLSIRTRNTTNKHMLVDYVEAFSHVRQTTSD